MAESVDGRVEATWVHKFVFSRLTDLETRGGGPGEDNIYRVIFEKGRVEEAASDQGRGVDECEKKEERVLEDLSDWSDECEKKIYFSFGKLENRESRRENELTEKSFRHLLYKRDKKRDRDIYGE